MTAKWNIQLVCYFLRECAYLLLFYLLTTVLLSLWHKQTTPWKDFIFIPYIKDYRTSSCKAFELKKKHLVLVILIFFHRLKTKNIKVHENLRSFNHIYAFLMSTSLNEKKTHNLKVQWIIIFHWSLRVN